MGKQSKYSTKNIQRHFLDHLLSLHTSLSLWKPLPPSAMPLPICSEERKRLQYLDLWLRPSAWTWAWERKTARQEAQMKVSVGVWPYCPERHPAPSLSYFSGNGWNKKAISAGQRVKQPIPSKARLLYLYHYPEYPFCSTSHNSCLCWKR